MNEQSMAGRIMAHAFHDELEKIAAYGFSKKYMRTASGEFDAGMKGWAPLSKFWKSFKHLPEKQRKERMRSVMKWRSQPPSGLKPNPKRPEQTR